MPLTAFLVLRAFASGAVALTGIEAVADGVTAFKPPEVTNARVGAGGARRDHDRALRRHDRARRPVRRRARASDETVVSQLARLVFGSGAIYYFIQAVSMLILILAANTAFADFPRLAYFMARDGYLPRQFGNRGDRLVFSNGVVMLTVVAAVLVVVFDGDTHALHPALRGRRLHLVHPVAGEHGAPLAAAAAAALARGESPSARLGAAHDRHRARGGGGDEVPGRRLDRHPAHRGPDHDRSWRSDSHYDAWPDSSRSTAYGAPAEMTHTVLVLVGDLHRGVVEALQYARTLSPGAKAVYVETDPERTRRLEEKWGRHGLGVPLVVLNSPYRSLLGPLVDYMRPPARTRRASTWSPW